MKDKIKDFPYKVISYADAIAMTEDDDIDQERAFLIKNSLVWNAKNVTSTNGVNVTMHPGSVFGCGAFEAHWSGTGDS